MRCKNCGWENDSNKTKCEKCNAPLSGSMIESIEHKHSSSGNNVNLKGTVPEGRIFVNDSFSNDKGANNGIVCSKCGYLIGRGMQVCPMCGTSIESETEEKCPPPQQNNALKCKKCGASILSGTRFCASCGTPVQIGTINPWTSPQSGTFCTLKPLAWENEHAEHNALSFSGEHIALNRANTDPNNQTITSKTQAELNFENGAWYICDRSSQQTTYIHAGRKTELKNGDIIILGNRRFKFNS